MAPDNLTPTIIPRAEHPISRSSISPGALKVLYRLHNANYRACLVGGGVRDLMLGREPKDFDVATDASPDEVRALFRNCRLIGRRFRLAHVRFGNEIVEVATFRGSATDADDANGDDAGRILRDNTWGTIEEDAVRRDFTVNALFYDIADFTVHDFVGGIEHLRAGTLQLIGDPGRRYREDPVRMLRAARFAAKLGFRLHPDTEGPIAELRHLLADIPPARLFEETLKLFLGGFAVQAYEHLRHLRLFEILFPDTEQSLAVEENHFPRTLLLRALEGTDQRVAEGKPVTPPFLFAALLWEPVRVRAQQLTAEALPELVALQQATDEVLSRQLSRVSIPKRFSLPMRDIFMLQARFAMRRGKRPLRLLAHPRFRAAYDFLVLRAAAGEVEQALADWWTELQETDGPGQEILIESAPADADGGAPKRKRRRRRRRKPAGDGDGAGTEAPG
ncbi:MAG: polynucleotide adenylyltransferase PcnB [Gammaproteobacteria bacterium]